MFAIIITFVSVAAAWVICLAQLASAYMVWHTGAGIYGPPGALAFAFYLPVLGCYLVASRHSQWRAHLAIGGAPVVGLIALVACG